MIKTEKKFKDPENPEEIRKPDKFPENEFFISYLRSKPSILSGYISNIADIWRFEKKGDECEEKKRKKKKEKKYQ